MRVKKRERHIYLYTEEEKEVVKKQNVINTFIVLEDSDSPLKLGIDVYGTKLGINVMEGRRRK